MLTRVSRCSVGQSSFASGWNRRGPVDVSHDDRASTGRCRVVSITRSAELRPLDGCAPGLGDTAGARSAGAANPASCADVGALLRDTHHRRVRRRGESCADVEWPLPIRARAAQSYECPSYRRPSKSSGVRLRRSLPARVARKAGGEVVERRDRARRGGIAEKVRGSRGGRQRAEGRAQRVVKRRESRSFASLGMPLTVYPSTLCPLPAALCPLIRCISDSAPCTSLRDPGR